MFLIIIKRNIEITTYKPEIKAIFSTEIQHVEYILISMLVNEISDADLVLNKSTFSTSYSRHLYSST